MLPEGDVQEGLALEQSQELTGLQRHPYPCPPARPSPCSLGDTCSCPRQPGSVHSESTDL